MPEYIFKKKVPTSSQVKWKHIFTVAICIALVGGIIYGVVCYLYRYIAEKEGICLTENCLKASVRILSSMDQNEDPCNDFYQFTCGNFIAKAYENDYVSRYHLQRIKNKNKINSIIAAPVTKDDVGIHLQQKYFYQSCMNVEAIDKEGLEPFQNLLEVLGGWPVVKGQDWKERNFNLTHSIINCKNFGFPFQWFFKIYSDNDLINIGIPKLTKNKVDSLSESNYLNLMTEMATTFGATNNLLTLREIKKVIYFEKKLKEISENQQNVMTIMTLDDLDGSFPIIDWFRFFNNISENYSISPQNSVGVQTEYIMNLNLLLANTPRRVLANFIIWKILQEFGYYLSKPVRDNFINSADLFPSRKEPIKTRFEFCIQEAIDRFPRVAETEFIQTSISQEKLDDVKDMISNIKNQYLNAVDTADWMDEGTKMIATDKVSNIVEIIGEQYLYFDNYVVNLTEFEFTTDNIINMVQEKNRDTFIHIFEGEITARTSMITDFIYTMIMYLDTSYGKASNILLIPPSILQDEFLALHIPKYLNYGSLGSIIGHEIGHIFDFFADGYNYEYEKKIVSDLLNGTILSPSQLLNWPAEIEWNSSSLEHITSEIDCLMKGGYAPDRILNEKHADLIGVDKVYEAYVAWAEEYAEEQHLPGLQFSPTQLFWIQLGVTNCYMQMDNENEESDLDTFGSLRQRISNIVHNSEHFAKDFECPEGSLANPIEKCPITMS